jgi:hypothetical protein
MFAELVARLGLGTLHTLFAQQISIFGLGPVCLQVVQMQMHLDDATVQWLVSDLLAMGLVRRNSDPNFICIDAERILACAKSFNTTSLNLSTRVCVETLSLANLTSSEIQQGRLHSPPKAEEPSRYPLFRLSRSGWQGGKSSHKHR